MIYFVFASILLIAGQFLFAFLLYWWAKRRVYDAFSKISAMVSPDESGNYQIPGVVLAVGQALASQVISAAKMQLMNLASQGSRQGKIVEGAVASDMLGQAGGIGALLSSFPALNKAIQKNPALGFAAQQIISRLAPSNGHLADVGVGGPATFESGFDGG